MESIFTKIYQTTKAKASGNVKQESLLFPKRVKMFRREMNSFGSHGPSPVMFADECVFQVERTTVTLSQSHQTKPP